MDPEPGILGPFWSDQLDWPLDDRASSSRSIGGDWGYFILSGGWLVELRGWRFGFCCIFEDIIL